MELVIDMRALLTFASFAALTACNPYDPDLGDTPFRCGSQDPVCPSGYACVSGLCERDVGGPDADTHADGACADLGEPNNMLTQATPGAVWDMRTMIMFESLTLCPMMDTDYFHLNQPTLCGGAGPACPNVTVTADFEDLSVQPTIAIQNATGVTIQMSSPTGPGQVRAVLTNAAQGQYYVRVTAQAVLGHYALTIDGTQPPI
jgi:hypothetical protein